MEELIYNIIATDEVKKRVGNNIQPIVASANTNGAYIVYSVTGEEDETTKDGITTTIVDAEVNVVTDSVQQAIAIKIELEKAIKKARKWQDLSVRAKRTGIAETYSDDKFVVSISFAVRIVGR